MKRKRKENQVCAKQLPVSPPRTHTKRRAVRLFRALCAQNVAAFCLSHFAFQRACWLRSSCCDKREPVCGRKRRLRSIWVEQMRSGGCFPCVLLQIGVVSPGETPGVRSVWALGGMQQRSTTLLGFRFRPENTFRMARRRERVDRTVMCALCTKRAGRTVPHGVPAAFWIRQRRGSMPSCKERAQGQHR